MARISTPLTNTEVEKAKPKLKEYNLSDGLGLFLRVKPNGSKLWIFNYYRPFTKKRNNLGLGLYPEVSLKQAREIRAEYRTLLAQDIDPYNHREKLLHEQYLENSNTFLHVSELWKAKKLTEIKSKTVLKYWRSLEIHVFPSLGKLPINQITPVSVIPILKVVENKGAFDMVHRLCGYINEILNFAVNSGLIELNSCLKLTSTFKKATKTNNPRIKSEELSEFLQILNKANIEQQTKYLIIFQLLTMVRPGEASQAEWSEIDFINNIWTIPAWKMKAGIAHEVPLSTQVVKLLELLKSRTANSKYIFPKRGNINEFMNPSTPNMALKRMGYKNRQTAHGLRGLARTYLAEQGIPYEHAEACLAHRIGSNVSLAYNHATYLEQRKIIMQKWGDYIEECSSVKMI